MVCRKSELAAINDSSVAVQFLILLFFSFLFFCSLLSGLLTSASVPTDRLFGYGTIIIQDETNETDSLIACSSIINYHLGVINKIGQTALN